MASTILIMGCGDVGSAYGQRMAARGHRVVGVKRHLNNLPQGIEGIAMDVASREALSMLPDADILVYAISADKFEEDAYQRAYPDGLDAVLNEFEQRGHPLRHVFFVSSTSVYPQVNGEVVDETTPTEPQRFSGQLMLKAEQRLLESTINGSVVRFSGIYGPGRERLINQVRDGFYAPETPQVYTNRIHRDDAAGVLAFLTERALGGTSLEDIYLASDGESAPLHDVMAWLARRLNVTPSQTAPSSTRRRSNKRCSSQRLRALGYRFSYPSFREGYEQVLANEQLG